MRRKSYQIGLSLALLCFCLLFPPRLAHARRPMFGTVTTEITGCAQDPSGAWFKTVARQSFFFWIGGEIVIDDVPAPECANQQQ
jgi:hypothetical protein